MNFISNAFSLNMIESPKLGRRFTIEVTKMEKALVLEEVQAGHYKSVIGHKDMAEIVSLELAAEVVFNRESIKLRAGDTMLVCQYAGPRLREGCTELPPGAQIDYYFVSIN